MISYIKYYGRDCLFYQNIVSFNIFVLWIGSDWVIICHRLKYLLLNHYKNISQHYLWRYFVYHLHSYTIIFVLYFLFPFLILSYMLNIKICFHHLCTMSANLSLNLFLSFAPYKKEQTSLFQKKNTNMYNPILTWYVPKKKKIIK